MRDVTYNVGVFKNDDGTASLATGVYQTPTGEPIGANGYQIISPGSDGKYGGGGSYSADDGFTPPGGLNDGGADNITNFVSSGTLGDG